MKKSLLALAVFGAFATTASAQVVLYGTADAAFGHFETEVRDNVGTGFTDEFTGVVDGGEFTTSPSRFGIKATSDIGNGLKGLAHFEAAIDLGTGEAGGGSNNALFHRRAVVGLTGGFGTVFLGRAQVPIHYTLSDVSVWDTSGLDTAQDTFTVFRDPVTGAAVETGSKIGYGAGPGGIRRDGSIYYTSPEFAGMKAELQYAPRKTETFVVGGATEERDVQAFGGSLSYENGPILVAAAFDRTEVEVNSTTTTENTSWLVGGVYDFNVAKVFANYMNSEREVTGGTFTPELRQYEIGVRAPIGKFIVLAGVGRNDYEAGAFEADGIDYALGLDYNLTKKTFLYARAGKTSVLEADNGSFEQDITSYGVGLRHSF